MQSTAYLLSSSPTPLPPSPSPSTTRPQPVYLFLSSGLISLSDSTPFLTPLRPKSKWPSDRQAVVDAFVEQYTLQPSLPVRQTLAAYLNVSVGQLKNHLIHRRRKQLLAEKESREREEKMKEEMSRLVEGWYERGLAGPLEEGWRWSDEFLERETSVCLPELSGEDGEDGEEKWVIFEDGSDPLGDHLRSVFPSSDGQLSSSLPVKRILLLPQGVDLERRRAFWPFTTGQTTHTPLPPVDNLSPFDSIFNPPSGGGPLVPPCELEKAGLALRSRTLRGWKSVVGQLEGGEWTLRPTQIRESSDTQPRLSLGPSAVVALPRSISHPVQLLSNSPPSALVEFALPPTSHKPVKRSGQFSLVTLALPSTPPTPTTPTTPTYPASLSPLPLSHTEVLQRLSRSIARRRHSSSASLNGGVRKDVGGGPRVGSRKSPGGDGLALRRRSACVFA